MYKKLVLVGIIVVACAAVLTTCRQPMVKQLQNSLLQANIEGVQLFGYNPDLELFPCQSPEDDLITISAHGYGANKKTGKYVAKMAPLTGYVLTFNLPDHDYVPGNGHFLKHGTIDEILPLAYAVKVAFAAGAKRINLYGFSAGGGVVVNLIGMLYSSRYDSALNDVGITKADKVAMLKAIERGVVLLDAPLKSVEEIIEGRGVNEEHVMLAQQYQDNNLRPIDAFARLQGLSLKIVLYFENPDEIIFNRDDAEFITRLEHANNLGVTRVMIGSNGGHVSWHEPLWQAYSALTLSE